MSYQVTVFHNLSRDASLGLNSSLVAADNERGYERVTTACSHKLVPVLTFGWESTAVPDLDAIFRWLNIGGAGEAQAVQLLVNEYRSRRNRSLSKGDVIQVSERFFACASAGWDEVTATDLHLITTYLSAAKAVRETYDFEPGELLSVSNPLGVINALAV